MIEPGATRVHELFGRAVSLAPADQRRFLDDECGSDAGLRFEVEQLLRWDAAAGPGFLEQPPARVTNAVAPAREGADRQIGTYTLLALIGEGGFGEVWTAEQRAPVRRRVALKILKPGMDSKEVLARFEAERQALALMDHPHVAKVFDAGQTESGRPYFVMEHVPGLSITEYCDSARLRIRPRLELFTSICHAVQHAHQKGIIHRDLKPSNILVALVDGQPVPKVIDFGIAKATAAPLTERTLHTEMGCMMGTPEYMSPEQAVTSALDVDTRTDVYSLGVILYQLLTGTLPFDPKALRNAGFEGILRIIRETEPPKPSTRLSALQSEPRPSGSGVSTSPLPDGRGSDLADIAARRNTEFGVLRRQLRGELDWIVMKCLEKDRTRRYDTANALAMEIRRYLTNEPVLAGPPSRSYRLRKLIRRNRGAVVSAGLVLTAMVTGFGVAVWQAVRAHREARRAEEQRSLAERRADETQQVADFQAQMLSQIDPTDAGVKLMSDIRERFDQALVRSGVSEAERAARNATLASELSGVNSTDTAVDMIDRTILKPALATLEKEFADQPVVDATLRHTLAVLYHKLGRNDDALHSQERALATARRVLGEEHPNTLSSINNMGSLLQALGMLDEAEPYYREALEKRRRILGEEHPDTLNSISNMGFLLEAQRKPDLAEPYYREALEKRRRVLGEEHPDTLVSIGNIGMLLRAQGKLDQAEPYCRESLEKRRRVFGEEHPETLTSINNMGALLRAQGKLDLAEPYYREALEKSRRVLGDEHPNTLKSINNMGFLMKAQGKLDQAAPYYREVVEKRRRVLGDEHPDTIRSSNNLASLLRDRGEHAEAERLLLDAAKLADTVLPPGHRERERLAMSLGELYEAWDKAEPGQGYDAKAAEWRAKLR